MDWAPPTPEEQVLFLRNIQRLLADGLFTASYKYALLLAFADLSVEEGDDSGAPLLLATRRIAEKYIEFYWQQCRPYEIGGTSTGIILKQNNDRQAAIITAIIRTQEEIGGSLFRVRESTPRAWKSLVTRVNRTVCDYPLKRLQNVGSEQLNFLYDNVEEATPSIILNRGVAFCFRAFYPLLRDLFQGGWVRKVQELNANKLGNPTDLSSFLFGRERGVLEAYRPVLIDVQHGRCFYCHKDLKRSVEVDHFVPWSRYPTDLGHNFVLSHPSCNNAKSDHLAAEDHLAAWIEQNRVHAAEIDARLLEAALPHDLAASLRVAEWAYEQTERANGQVWLEKSVFQHLGPEWRQLLVA